MNKIRTLWHLLGIHHGHAINNVSPTSCQLRSNKNTEMLLKIKKAAINILNPEHVI